MKSIYLLIIASFVTSCEQFQRSTEYQGKLKQYSGDYRMFNEVYDIADLKSYSDKSKFIGRLTCFIPFKAKTIIELDEIANGINLCAKQPVVVLMAGEYFDSSRSVPFNQVCYWYSDSTAKSVKKLFERFNSGNEVEDRQCKSCLDPIFWRIEIYDHGKYSSIIKDYFSKLDKPFIDSIFDKAHLKENEEYRLPIFK
jgi:hypothetical protein